MDEAVVGVYSNQIVNHKATSEGSLTVSHKKFSLVADTIGHVLAIPTTHTILWTWGSMFKNPSKELATQIFDRYKDVPWKGDVLVRVGYTDIIGDIARIMARNEDVRGRPWMLKDKIGRAAEIVGKLGAVVLTVPQMWLSKLFRLDYYNVFANTANVYHPKLAIGMHEVGHAEYFNQLDPRKRAGLLIGMWNPLVSIPFMDSFVEWQASKNAMMRFKNDAERREGLKRLEAGWATYYFADILMPIPLPKPVKDMIGAVLSYPASIAGHAMARWYPKQSERFGYVFEGKEAPKKPGVVPALSDRQMLVARAYPAYVGKQR